MKGSIWPPFPISSLFAFRVTLSGSTWAGLGFGGLWIKHTIGGLLFCYWNHANEINISLHYWLTRCCSLKTSYLSAFVLLEWFFFFPLFESLGFENAFKWYLCFSFFKSKSLPPPTHTQQQKQTNKQKNNHRSCSGLTSDAKLGTSLRVGFDKSGPRRSLGSGQPEQHSVFHQPGNLPLEMPD